MTDYSSPYKKDCPKPNAWGPKRKAKFIPPLPSNKEIIRLQKKGRKSNKYSIKRKK